MKKYSITLLIIAFGILLVSNTTYLPVSAIGKTNLIIIAVMTTLKLLSYFFIWWFSTFLILRWIYSSHFISSSKCVKISLSVIISLNSFILPFVFYSSNININNRHNDIIYDFTFPFYTVLDIIKDNTNTIEFDSCIIDQTDYSGYLVGGDRYYDKRYSINIDEKVFVIRHNDINQFKYFTAYYHSDDSQFIGTIVYYKNSGLIKSVDITPTIYVENEPVLKNLEIWMETNKNGTVLIKRPKLSRYDDVDQYSIEFVTMDKNLFWYVTKDGEFCKCFQAYRSTWTNVLTSADKGNYAVTLVTDYDDATGEYTPISNTIEYMVE